MASIVLTLDGEIVHEYDLTQARTTIGRRPYHDIVIDNLAVSGDHAVIARTPKGYVIVHGERRWRAARMAGLEAIPAYLVQEIGQNDGVAA